MSLKYLSISGEHILVNGKKTTNANEVGEALLVNLSHSKKILDDLSEITNLIRMKQDFDIVSNWLMSQPELDCLPVAKEREEMKIQYFPFFNKVIDMADFIKGKRLK